MISIFELFSAAGLSPCGPVCWGEPVPERGPGVYVIVENAKGIVYIGRTKRTLFKRIKEFYRPVLGARGPHHGGQDILDISRCPGPKIVYWAPTADSHRAQSTMIAAFEKREGVLPIGNKARPLPPHRQISAQPYVFATNAVMSFIPPR